MSKAGDYVQRLKHEVTERGVMSSLKWAASTSRREVMTRTLSIKYGRTDKEFSRVTPGYIINQLAETGFSVDYYAVNRVDYQKFLVAAGYTRPITNQNEAEKQLESFLALKFLDLQAGDVLLDISSNNARFAAMVEKQVDLQVYRHSANFKSGIDGQQIGGAITAIPLPDEAVSKIIISSAFEALEGRDDTTFLKEAARLLRPGGKLCIVPLQISDQYYNLSDPLVSKRDIVFDDGVPVVMRPGWGKRFGRHYNVAQVVRRVLRPAKSYGLTANLYYVSNTTMLDPGIYLKFFAVLEKTA